MTNAIPAKLTSTDAAAINAASRARFAAQEESYRLIREINAKLQADLYAHASRIGAPEPVLREMYALLPEVA